MSGEASAATFAGKGGIKGQGKETPLRHGLGVQAGGDIHIGCTESEGIRHLVQRIKEL